MQDLIERVRKECATAYFAASDTASRVPGFTPIGCSLVGSDNLHFVSSYIEDHYSRWNPFLPKGFKTLMRASSKGRNDGSGINIFYLAHYRLDQNKVLAKVKKMHKILADFDVEEFLADFARFDNPTAIYPFYLGVGRHSSSFTTPTIVGSEEIQNEIMAYFKRDPSLIFDFFDEVGPFERPVMDNIREGANSIHIYDLVKRPRIVYHQL